jgi:tetratricopeptide (TPR) repeat protein
MSLIEKTIIDEGKKFLEADNPLKAIECFDEAIDEFKKSGIDQVYYYKGIALSSSGNNIEAAKCFYQYILMSHEDAEKCLSNGNNLFDKNLIKAAIIFYDEAINLNQSLEEAHYRKGLALSASNEYSNAIVCFEKAISLNPNYAEAYCEKGIAMYYLNINNSKQANSKIMSCFDKAIEVNQLYTKAYFAKGKMCYKMNKYEDAIIMYNKAIEIEPKYAEAYNYKGLAFHAMSNYEEAIKCYDVSINYGYWTAHYNRGIIFAATNRYDDAIYDFDRVIQLEHSQLIIDRAIEEKLRVYKILGKPTDKLCHDEQKHARKEKNVPDMLFSQKKIKPPPRLSIKRAFELSHIHFMTAQNTLSPPMEIV